MNDTNVALAGRIDDEPEYSHTFNGSRFFRFTVATCRESGTIDAVPVIISERDIKRHGWNSFSYGTHIAINGTFRSYNEERDGRKILVLYVKPEAIFFGDHGSVNEILMDCIICKRPELRRTPNGRNICDMLTVLPYVNQKCAYVPCIAFGNLAKQAETFTIGQKLRISGKIQSRKYYKNGAERVAIEIVANKIAPPV